MPESKSFRGLTTYKMDLTGIEGFLVALALLIIPFVILTILIKLLLLLEEGVGRRRDIMRGAFHEGRFPLCRQS